jgi:hypothetical protein
MSVVCSIIKRLLEEMMPLGAWTRKMILYHNIVEIHPDDVLWLDTDGVTPVHTN